MTPFQKTSLWYAKHDKSVFQLGERSKKPITEHGFKDATTDVPTVERLWKEHPNANIGIPMGAASGLLLLDVDYPATEGRIESRADLIELYGPIPDTAEVITGRGRHFYFRFPGGKVPTAIAKGIELKGNGGYAVAPPSVHPNGATYRFDGLDDKAILHPASPPKWLIEQIAEANEARPKSKTGTAEEKKWSQGERNTQLASLAGKLRYAGLAEEAILEALRAANRFHCVPPLPEAEIKAIAKSYGKYPAGGGYSRTANLNVNVDTLDPNIEVLNACAIFGGQIKFASLHRRGPMIVARFINGAETIWPSISVLTNFTKSQALIAEATQALIMTPARRAIKSLWEPAVQLILRLAEGDRVSADEKLKDEFADIIHSVWKRSGCTHATTDEEFFNLLRACLSHARDPQSPPPPFCIWHDDQYCYVHQPSLVEWLSTPGGRNKHYEWDEVRNALLLLGFIPEQIHRSFGNERAKVRLWRGPLNLLVEDET